MEPLLSTRWVELELVKLWPLAQLILIMYRLCIIISIVIFILKTHFGIFVGVIVPALRGKDYGKTRMRFPDYTETLSGLQYKVTIEQPLLIFFVYQYNTLLF